MRWFASVVGVIGLTGVTLAQPPGQLSLNYLPNFYNRQSQPLSPYLNLFRGSNPATNYYYGVRPGTPAGGVNRFGMAPPVQLPVGPTAGGFLPQVPVESSASMFDGGGQPVRLASPGHPVLFGNQFAGHGSFFSVYASNINRSGFTPGRQQPLNSSAGGTNNRPTTQPPAGGRRPPTISVVP